MSSALAGKELPLPRVECCRSADRQALTSRVGLRIDGLFNHRARPPPKAAADGGARGQEAIVHDRVAAKLRRTCAAVADVVAVAAVDLLRVKPQVNVERWDKTAVETICRPGDPDFGAASCASALSGRELDV